MKLAARVLAWCVLVLYVMGLAMLIRYAGNHTVNALIAINVASLIALAVVLTSLHRPKSLTVVRAGAVLSILWVFYGVGILLVALFGFAASIREPKLIAMIAAGILAVFTVPGSIWFLYLRAQMFAGVSSRSALQ